MQANSGQCSAAGDACIARSQKPGYRYRWLWLLALLLAACAPGMDAPLPTMAELPTLLPSATVTPTVASAALAATATPAEATTTATASVTAPPAPTLSVTPSATITDTPTPTASDTPTITPTDAPPPDNEGLLALVQLAARATVLPPQPTSPVALAPTAVLPAAPTCAYPPPGGFAAVYAVDAALAAQLGCPLGTPPAPVSVASASQLLQAGEMLWLAGPTGQIYALFSSGRYQRYDDTFVSGADPESGPEQPPPGLLQPIRGFGKIWRTFAEVRALGWAVTGELGGQALAQPFERGLMVSLPQRGLIVILVSDPGGLTGAWRAATGSA